MYNEKMVDDNIRLSAIVFTLVESLKNIKDNAETVESAKFWAEDAIELYKQMRKRNGC